MCKKIQGAVNSYYYALFNLCFKTEMRYSRFSSFEVMCKTHNSDRFWRVSGFETS